MEDFEAYLKTATTKGENVIPGAVMAVVDKDGMQFRFVVSRFF